MHFQTGRFAHTQSFAWHVNDYEGWTDMDFLSILSFQQPKSTDVVLVYFQSLHSLCSYS